MRGIVEIVETVARHLVRRGELQEVKVIERPRAVLVEIHVRGRAASGALIGTKGETIQALRHLCRRVAKRANAPLAVDVQVVTVETEVALT